MKTLLTDIQSRLQEKAASFNYLAEDWGQLDYYDDSPPVKFPCVLIDLASARWENNGQLQQAGRVEVSLTIADQPMRNVSSMAPMNQQENQFRIFELLKEVHDALHGYTGAQHYSSLIRTSSVRTKPGSGLKVFHLTYSCELTESPTPPKTISIKLRPDLEVCP